MLWRTQRAVKGVRWKGRKRRKRAGIDKHREGETLANLLCYVLFFFENSSCARCDNCFFARSDGFGIRNKKLGFYFSFFFFLFLLVVLT